MPETLHAIAPLRFGPAAVARIRHLCTTTRGVETGGLLLARDGVIQAVTGSGPAAVAGPRRLSWDPSYIAGCLDILEQTDLEVVGRWHKHVSPVIRASSDDREGAAAFLRALELDAMVDVIVATGNGDEPIAIAAYGCTVAGYEEISCITEGLAVD